MMEYSFIKMELSTREYRDDTQISPPGRGIWRTRSAARAPSRGKSPSSLEVNPRVLAPLLALMVILVVAGGVFAQTELKIRSVGIIDRDVMEQPLSYPSHVYCDAQDDEVYITDSAHNRVVVCNSNYFPIHTFGINPERGNLAGMDRISGYLSVIIRGRGEHADGLQVFDDAYLPVEMKEFRDVPTLPEQMFLPNRVVYGVNKKFYVISENSGPVYVFDSEGNFDHLLQPHDTILGIREPASVRDIAVDANGKLYLLSEERGRVYVYDGNEIFLFKFGQKGGDRGKLARPRGIAINTEKKQIYIADYLRHAVSIYTLQGEFVDEFGGKGTGKGWLYYPSDVAVDQKGHVLVADTFNHRIQAFALP